MCITFKTDSIKESGYLYPLYVLYLLLGNHCLSFSSIKASDGMMSHFKDQTVL